MNPQSQIEHLADMAREHQAEMLRLSGSEGQTPAAPNRWRVGLAALVVLALPAAVIFVRAW